jgi:hypothetical protein
MKAFPATRLVSSRLCRSLPATALSRGAPCATEATSDAPEPGLLRMTIRVILPRGAADAA